jgi:stress response protein YsnF
VITQNDIARLTDADVYDTDGDKIGSVGQVYLDSQSGDPEWVSVKTGLFGTKETFVPLQRASVTDDRVTVDYAKSLVKDAPQIDADGPLSYADEDTLYQHYGIESNGYAAPSSSSSSASGGHAKNTDDDGSMTRSEERLVAGTRTEQAGKARLRKHVVTETEHEPITDANAGDAYAGAEITEAEHEVTLRAERPVVDTEAVAVERVRLGKETVHDTETVSGEVRKEQIEFDGPEGRTNN